MRKQRILQTLKANQLKALVKQGHIECDNLRKKESLINGLDKLSIVELENLMKLVNIEVALEGEGRTFVAIDFETANRERHSACSVALVKVCDGEIVKTWSSFIKPTSMYFEFSHIHGISSRTVKNAPSYLEIHPMVENFMADADFIVAHNAPFDRSVLNAVTSYYDLSPLVKPWCCTVKMSRKELNLHPTTLPDVCKKFGISLSHHNAESDALACAKIMLEIQKVLNQNRV